MLYSISSFQHFSWGVVAYMCFLYDFVEEYRKLERGNKCSAYKF
uniref:Uncharacterized protein n=1 Tax=Rhizophora mucronata TaxID=61149 RepID=A0A2P2QEZ7_RHIMU